MYKVFLFIESVFFLQYGRDENTVSDSCSTGWSTRLFLFFSLSRGLHALPMLSLMSTFYGIWNWMEWVCLR